MRHAVVIENVQANDSAGVLAKNIAQPIKQQKIHPESANPIRA